MVFYDLVLNNAHSGLLNRHFGKRNTRLVGRRGSRKKYFVDLLLRIAGINALSLLHGKKGLLKLFDSVDNFPFVGHLFLSLKIT